MSFLRNKSMEFLKRFEVPAKNPSEDAQRRWREAVGTLVKNRRRRFRMVPDLDKRSQAETQRRKIQEKLRVALYVQKAALQFIDAARKTEHPLPEIARQCGFAISAEELASVVRGKDAKSLRHHKGVDGVARKVNVSLADGVKSDDAGLRTEVYGANQYTEKPPRTFWMYLWDASQDMTLLLLAFCAVISVVIGLATEGWPGGMYDGVGIVLTIALVVMITAASDYKQSLQFRDLDKEKKKIDMHVTRDGYRQKVSIYGVVVGDIVHLSIGDQVPADGLFIDGYSFLVDESSLSGESEPVHVSNTNPFLLGGTKVQDGSARMLVTAVGMRTEWGNLMETLSQGGEDETPLQVKLNGVATIIGKIGLAFAVLTFTVLMARFLANKAHAPGGGLLRWSMADALSVLDFFAVAVTIIVVAVPEGLPLAVTLSLAFAMKKLMQERALVRHLSACETMGSASCICTDKTGTLTTNHMVVEKVWAGAAVHTVSTSKGFEELKASVSDNFSKVLLEGVFHCSGSEVVRDKDGKATVMGTPTEAAILEFGLEVERHTKVEHAGAKKLKVEPFNSVKKTMAVAVASPHAAGRPRAFLKGASEVVLQRCSCVVDGSGSVEKLTDAKAKRVASAIGAFACEALRTLCLAYQDVGTGGDIPSDGYTLIAVFGIKDPLRPGVREAVRTCHAAGINVRMVTGDNINTAKAIARECGILTDDGIAIEGPDFRAKSPDEMREIIPKIQVMARSLPLDKHTLVTNLRGMFEEVVAVTGDGTNDAPALHEADIGLAMGIAGTEVAKENADVIIMDDNFSTIINVAKWGRSVYINIQKFVQFQLTVNVVALMVNFVSASFTGSAPLTIVQLLWVNLIMDTLGALALATEPPNDAMMQRPPVGRGDNFITKVMWRNITGQSIYQLIVLGVLIFKGKGLLHMTGAHADALLNTFIFNTFVFCQVFNEVNSREMEKINVFSGMFSSWVFSAVVGATVGFQVIMVELLGTFAGTVHLSGKLWLASVLIGSVSLVIGAVLKCIPVDSGSDSSDHRDGYQPIPTGPNAV
ncbi:hypothetical protein ACP4OV_019903 [Aristida adscensionis]